MIIPSGRGSGRKSARGGCVDVGCWVGIGSGVCIEAGSRISTDDVCVSIDEEMVVSTPGWQDVVKTIIIRSSIRKI